ncbi:hypothetical protein [Alienimonas chondri]|uniref:Phage tail protein n=1 Tax=Alienimonas chondri TaxID=2681879 RepID=A0ABX1VD40_9PLAN|nr:hypothetical protein [Alienimonas chondri]NNJ25886.1 hypothetical protein [Alienimonas chondri]
MIAHSNPTDGETLATADRCGSAGERRADDEPGLERTENRDRMWLGERRGNAVDWSTQLWVRLTGRRVDLAAEPWLDSPVGPTRGIGPDFLDRWASEEGLTLTRGGAGLLPSFQELAGSTFDPAAVDPAIGEFYERTADFDVDLWSEWSGLFKLFGWLVAALFSRRLRQLNLPLSPLDASHGMTSEIVRVADDKTGAVRANAWVRSLVKTGRITYVGSYSIARPPGAAGPCVKTAFPLPNGAAVVFLRPEARADGSLVLLSEGAGFGDAGFYFTVHRPDGSVVARRLQCFRERIHVYPASDGEGGGDLRADHTMTLWGLRCLHLHYRLRQKAGGWSAGDRAAGGHAET